MLSRLVATPLRVGARSYSNFFSSSKPPGLVKQAQNVVKRETQTTQAEPTVPSPTPIPTMHPSPVLATMHLHSFFALDRPMLLLSQPTSRLFNTSPPPRPVEDAGESESDADAARALSHALVMSKVQNAASWAQTMERLGLQPAAQEPSQDELDAMMDSVKRKRRKKITKHKYKKRRKLQRSERRRLGK